MAQGARFEQDDESSADAPPMVDRLGGLAWACLFVLALVVVALVASF